MSQIRLENLNIWIKFLKKIYGLVFLSIWAWFFHQCFLIYTTNKDFFIRIINLEFMDDKTMIDNMISLGIHCGKILGLFVAALIIYSIIKRIFRSIPLPTLLIDKWNNTNQISPMLAHRLIAHYTYSTTLSFYDLINIYDASEYEANTLSYNFNKKNLSGLFKRFNPNLVSEINIYNNYFPHMNLWQKTKTFFTGKPFRKPLLNQNNFSAPTNSNNSELNQLIASKSSDEESINKQESQLSDNSANKQLNDAPSSVIYTDSKSLQNQAVYISTIPSNAKKDPSNPFLETKKS